jgi:hypothetical protein
MVSRIVYQSSSLHLNCVVSMDFLSVSLNFVSSYSRDFLGLINDILNVSWSFAFRNEKLAVLGYI